MWGKLVNSGPARAVSPNRLEARGARQLGLPSPCPWRGLASTVEPANLARGGAVAVVALRTAGPAAEVKEANREEAGDEPGQDEWGKCRFCRGVPGGESPGRDGKEAGANHFRRSVQGTRNVLRQR